MPTSAHIALLPSGDKGNALVQVLNQVMERDAESVHDHFLCIARYDPEQAGAALRRLEDLITDHGPGWKGKQVFLYAHPGSTADDEDDVNPFFESLSESLRRCHPACVAAVYAYRDGSRFAYFPAIHYKPRHISDVLAIFQTIKNGRRDLIGEVLSSLDESQGI